MLVYRGYFPGGLEADPTIPSLRGGFTYPLAYGYACVGVIRETGANVAQALQGRPVFAFQPHTSHFVAPMESLLLIPDSISPERACFLPNMETAVNLVQDGAPILGERALVLGQGIVGLLVTGLLREFPLESLVAADCYELRRNSCPASPRRCLDPRSPDFRTEAANLLNGRADLAFELSGNPAALDDAVALTCFSGRVVIGSWYGAKSAEIDLGTAFHRSRIRLISSQVSTIAPELSGRWNKARRFQTTWKALERIEPEKWITHRYAIEDAAEAYRLLDEHPHETIQILFQYPS
jgi:2-desacetyl-2-hydroxyethyl bacteriochlorophyllide A dehydrogenase